MIVFCTDCKLFLCFYCKESYKYSKGHCSHNLISLTELRTNEDLIQSKSKFPTCQEHGLELEYYCETCGKLVCLRCTTKEHKDHKYNVVKKVVNKYCNEWKEVTASVQLMSEDLFKLHDSIEDVRIKIRKQSNEISKDIDLHYDKVIKNLLEQKEQVKQQLHGTVLEKERALTGQLEEVIQTQEDISDIKRIRDAVQENQDQEFLSGRDQLVSSLDRLIKKCEKLGQKPAESASINVTFANEPLPQFVKHFPATEIIMKPDKIITCGDTHSFGQLCGIACGNNGTFAVADWLNSCVHIFDSQGELIKKLGSQGSGYGEFKCPYDVAFGYNNELYVTDNHNHRVQKFNNCGDYLLQFGAKGAGAGQLCYPVGIATHQDKVYVADCQNNRISVFQNNGKFRTIVGQHHLSRSFDIAVNINSEILAADWGHHCIYFFTKDGFCANKMHICKEASGLELQHPCSLTTDSNGFIFIADTMYHCIFIFDRIGNCIGSFQSDDEFKFPSGIAIDPICNIYVSDSDSNRIQIFPAFF